MTSTSTSVGASPSADAEPMRELYAPVQTTLLDALSPSDAATSASSASEPLAAPAEPQQAAADKPKVAASEAAKPVASSTEADKEQDDHSKQTQGEH